MEPAAHSAGTSRRHLLCRCGLGAAALLVGTPRGALRALEPTALPVRRPTTARPYLEAAQEAARWIRASAVRAPQGLVWPADPQKPDERPANLYSGSAGVVLFLLELHRATGDRQALDDALAGADWLAATLPAADAPADAVQAAVRDAGLYTGVAGLAVVLEAAHQVGGQERHRLAARRALDLLALAATTRDDGVAWSPVTDVVSGTAGIGLALLQLHQRLGDARALDLAVRAGRRLVRLAQPAPAGLPGRRWEMSPGFAREMPNFSHGTAGIAYFLATLHQAAPEPAFLAAALDGGRYLQAIAATPAPGARLVHHHTPDGEDLFYLGWCHGPVGTARLFHRLGEATGDTAWREWVRMGARGITRSGVPEQRTPGFWNNVSVCCGNAGVSDFFLSLHRTLGDAAHLAYAERVAQDTLRRATRDAAGMRWVQAEHRAQPALLVAQTGYMQGAAGVGTAMLRLDAALHGRAMAVTLPDTPFEG